MRLRTPQDRPGPTANDRRHGNKNPKETSLRGRQDTIKNELSNYNRPPLRRPEKRAAAALLRELS